MANCPWIAGASGAVMGEFIAQQMYSGIKREDLTEEQRQTISALGTLAAGLAGGIVGDSTADAVAGGQAGKNTLENNNLANVLAAANKQKPGTIEQWQVDKQAEIKEACSGGTPVSCQTMMAAAGTLMIGGGTAGAAAKLTSAGISMGINGAVQGYQVIKNPDSEFSYTDFLMSGATGWLSAGTGVMHSAVIGVNTAYIGSSLKGEDPANAVLGSLGGSLIGFSTGKLIEVPLKPLFNNVRDKYDDIPVIYPWITTGKPQSPIPGTVGGLGGSVGAELGGKYTEDEVKDIRDGQ